MTQDETPLFCLELVLWDWIPLELSRLESMKRYASLIINQITFQQTDQPSHVPGAGCWDTDMNTSQRCHPCSQETYSEIQELKNSIFKNIPSFLPVLVLGYRLHIEVVTPEYPGSFVINCNHASGQISHYHQNLLYPLTTNRKILSQHGIFSSWLSFYISQY